MNQRQVKTPVVLIIFNRPDTTQKVFEAIREAQPAKLLVIADGPRTDRPGEAEKCAATRAIIEQVDWGCQVFTNYSETNLGCKIRVSTGLDWVFDTVEEAIILEDDCLPHPSFFQLCDELLEKYQDDQRIMSISGSNYQWGQKRTPYSYYFSRYSHCWGWATWRRAWQHYDIEMKLWPELQNSDFLISILNDPVAVKAWNSAFQVSYDNTVNNWGYRWTFACWVQHGLSIIPEVNLISNIGVGEDATHTTAESSKHGEMPVEPIEFPLKHPPYVVRNHQADEYTQVSVYDYVPTFSRRFQRKVNKILNKKVFSVPG